jgi:hypothetical protein
MRPNRSGAELYYVMRRANRAMQQGPFRWLALLTKANISKTSRSAACASSVSFVRPPRQTSALWADRLARSVNKLIATPQSSPGYANHQHWCVVECRMSLLFADRPADAPQSMNCEHAFAKTKGLDRGKGGC